MANKPKLKRLLVYILIFSLVLSAGVGIYVLLAGDCGVTEGQILATTGLLGLFAIFGLSCSILHEKGRYRWFALSGVIISSLSFVLILFPVWGDSNVFDHIWKYAVSASIVSLSIAHSSLLLLIIPKTSLIKWLLRLTIFFNTCLGLLAVVLTMMEFEGFNDIWLRLLGVLAILSVLGTIVTPILYKMKRQAPVDSDKRG